jgi:hypothetical protein
MYSTDCLGVEFSETKQKDVHVSIGASDANDEIGRCLRSESLPDF